MALVTVILLVLSFFVIVISKYYQDYASKEYSLTNCGSVQVTMQQAYHDYTLSKERQTGLLNCYCYSQILTIK